MAETHSTGLKAWLLENAWTLLIALVAIGITYGTIQVENNWRDTRLSALEKDVEIQKIRQSEFDKLLISQQFKDQSHEQAIQNLTTDSKVMQQAISDIKAQLSVLSTKLDALSSTMAEIKDMLKQQQRQQP